MLSRRAFLPVPSLVLLGTVLVGLACAHNRDWSQAPPAIKLQTGTPLSLLLVDFVEDTGWGHETRYTAIYTAPDDHGTLVVSGRGGHTRALHITEVQHLARLIENEGILHAKPALEICDDCASWRILVRLNASSNEYQLTGWPNRPSLATHVVELAQR